MIQLNLEEEEFELLGKAFMTTTIPVNLAKLSMSIMEKINAAGEKHNKSQKKE